MVMFGFHYLYYSVLYLTLPGGGEVVVTSEEQI